MIQQPIPKRRILNFYEFVKIRICSFKIGCWIRRIVYDRNHYFGLDPKPKLKLADTTLTDTETGTTFQRKNLVTDSVGYFFRHKRAPFQILFWRSGFIFKPIKAYIPPRSGKHENNLKKFEKKNGFEKQFRLRCRYWNWILVSVPDTETWLQSYTTGEKDIWKEMS